jgi:hypothetical protein
MNEVQENDYAYHADRLLRLIARRDELPPGSDLIPALVSRYTQIPEYARIGCFAALKPDLPHFRCRVKLRFKHPKAAHALLEARNLPAHTSAV